MFIEILYKLQMDGVAVTEIHREYFNNFTTNFQYKKYHILHGNASLILTKYQESAFTCL